MLSVSHSMTNSALEPCFQFKVKYLTCMYWLAWLFVSLQLFKYMLEIFLSILLLASLEFRMIFTKDVLKHIRLYSLLTIFNFILFFFWHSLIMNFLNFFLLWITTTPNSICYLADLALDTLWWKLLTCHEMDLWFTHILILEFR